MSIETCILNLDRTGKELQPHGTVDFPCAAYSGVYTECPAVFVPWHWHEEIELVYIRTGALELKLQTGSFFLKQGDCFAINSNAIHYAAGAPSCELLTLVFRPLLITGNSDSIFARKYILPLTSSHIFTGYLLKAGTSAPSDCFVRAFEAMKQELPGYEFVVRENLSRICFFLYRQFEKELSGEDIRLDHDTLRIRTMLEYISSSFAENLNLSDIAGKAGIGERECLRCFHRTMQCSPMQYLLKYRIMQGAEMLLKNPAESISSISALCGFDSPSNFSKMFKRFYRYTPSEYRCMH